MSPSPAETRSLAETVSSAPRLSASAAARRQLEALIAEPQAEGLGLLLAAGRTRDLLLGLADHSPYLWTLATEDPARLARLLSPRQKRRWTGLSPRSSPAATTTKRR